MAVMMSPVNDVPSISFTSIAPNRSAAATHKSNAQPIHARRPEVTCPTLPNPAVAGLGHFSNFPRLRVGNASPLTASCRGLHEARDTPPPSDVLDALRSEGDVNLSPRRKDFASRHLGEATRDVLAEDARVFLHQSLSTPCLKAWREQLAFQATQPAKHRRPNWRSDCLGKPCQRTRRYIFACRNELVRCL